MTEQVQNVPRYGWSLLRRALIILAIVIATLLLMEIGSRIFVNIMVNRQKHRAEMPLLDFDPITRYARSGIYWRLKPNLDGVRIKGYVGDTLFECSVSTDARGFRGPLVSAGEDAMRILAIGDSTTFGLGVEDEKAWPALLNEILRSKGKQVEVVNAGVCGYSADQGLAFLESYGFPLAPSLVVATFGYNDRCDWGFNLYRFWSSRAVILLRAALSYVGIGGQDGEDKNIRPRLTPGEFLDTLLDTEAACRANGSKTCFVMWPRKADLVNDAPDPASYVSLVQEAAIRADSACVDAVSLFRKATAPVFLEDDDVHASEYGNRIVAEEVANVIMPLLGTP